MKEREKAPRVGRFITFEGSEGSGKSTQIALLEEALTTQGIEVIKTREPGGTQLGESIRELLLHREMASKTELLLMFAARAEHWLTKIEPALKRGQWVISDRFTESSYAYQGFGRGIPLNEIAQLEALILGEKRPDRTFWLTLPLEIGLERAGKRAKLDRFEQEELSFFKRVDDGFATLAQERPQQFVTIDASPTVEEIHHTILESLSQWIEAAKGEYDGEA